MALSGPPFDGDRRVISEQDPCQLAECEIYRHLGAAQAELVCAPRRGAAVRCGSAARYGGALGASICDRRQMCSDGPNVAMDLAFHVLVGRMIWKSGCPSITASISARKATI